MQTYIVSIIVKTGHEDDVVRFYQDLEPQLREAPGFHGRQIFKANTGTMAAAVKKLYTAEELAKHAEPEHGDAGVQIIMLEQWDSVEERMLFSKNVAGGRQREIIPHLLPNHSHEFYTDCSVT
ncbi:MAG TPA: hypothetical protein QF499_05655 [Gammaproteobacteria bacterium]|jgi:hypothetical protein|nr:hypothetical protein [Gammaproteobacteria bacterium]MDP7659872.1 hypothetical protein [Gammaproteobacteria bacterium]HJP38602.1 hypothetical protein [Gammaproteobacteria bacterium]